MTPQQTASKYFLYARKSSENEDKQVASVPSQIEELRKLAQDYNLRIIDILTEEKSAKAPGRIVFNQMLQDIHEGKANGILCWKLDRLARNPVDGGNITWMLQQGVLQHIQTFQKGYFPTDNVLMMSVEFGMANQFILDLSLNTKRGQRAKADKGWLPHKPPIGYSNNKHNLPDLPPIYSDPYFFPIMKKIWNVLLEEKCSVEQIYERSFKLGLRTRSGNEFGRSSFYRMLRNPFYYGEFDWQGKRYKGVHEPMISKEEFDLAQDIIDGRVKQLNKRDGFAFRGLIRCGECGAAITSEHKTKQQKNGNVHHYTYYHCTKRIKRDCSQQLVRNDALDQQILDLLDKISIPLPFHQWVIKQLRTENETDEKESHNSKNLIYKNLESVKKRLDNLLSLRVSEEITTEEYSSKRNELIKEKERWESALKNTPRSNWIEEAEKVFDFAESAKKRFQEGDWQVKQSITAELSSNLRLQDQILDIPVEKNKAFLLGLAPEIKSLHNRFEPLQVVENIHSWEALYAQNNIWGLWVDKSRVSEPQRIQLVIPFYRRRYGKLEASLDCALPQKPIKEPDPPPNIINEAIRVKDFMAAHPDETCLSAAAKLNLPRKRISKLLTIANNLPPNLITELANCSNPKILRQMHVKHLLRLAQTSVS